jgi:hypothetical protein
MFVIRIDFTVKHEYEFKYTAVILKVAVFYQVLGRWVPRLCRNLQPWFSGYKLQDVTYQKTIILTRPWEHKTSITFVIICSNSERVDQGFLSVHVVVMHWQQLKDRIIANNETSDELNHKTLQSSRIMKAF